MVEKLKLTNMRILKYITVVMFLAAILPSCEKNYEDHITKVTPAPVMELIGGNPIVLFKGTPFVDPGIHAYEMNGDQQVDLTYEVTNEVNVDITGTYKLNYKVLNSENVPFYISRRVSIVSFTGYDVFEIPSGTYDGVRVGRGGGPVQITKLAPGVYQISDLLGAYYTDVVGYDASTAAPAILVISEDGSIRSELGNAPGFGSDVVGSNFVFDAATNVLTFKATLIAYAFGFDVQLTLQ